MAANINLLGRKVLLTGIFLSLAAMFVSSILYRVEHPNLTVQSKQQRHAPEGMRQMGMGGLKEMMAKVESEPENVNNLIELSNAFLMMRAWDRALVFLEKARALQPDNLMILKSVGICYFQKQKYEEAVEVYEHILGLDDKDALAHYNLGIIFRHFLHDPESSARHFRAVLDLAHNDEEMKKNARSELKELGKL